MTSKTSGHDLRPTGFRSAAVMSMNARSPAIAERGGPDHRVDGRAGGEPGERSRPTTRNAEQPHRRDRPGQPLGQDGVEVHAQARPPRRRHRVERGDRARLGEPQRAARRRAPTRCPAARRSAPRPGGRGRRGRAPAGRSRHAAAAGRWRDRAPVDHPVVGVDRAGDDGVAKARRGVEHAAGAPAADRVGGEQHARDLRVDHPLHHHGELGARVRDARVGAVGHGPVRPQRRPAAAHRVQHGVDADHVQVGVLLAREARARAGPRRWPTTAPRPAPASPSAV